MIVPVDETNIAAAGAVHAESWRESHSFCTPEFVAAHTAETQTEYLRREMDAGKALFLLLDPEPVGVVFLPSSAGSAYRRNAAFSASASSC